MELLKKTTTQTFPAVHSAVHRTPSGIPYLRHPGAFMMVQPHFNVEGLRGFLSGFDEELGFMQYMDDDWDNIQDGDAAIKVAGQLCYMSFGENRTRNSDAPKYLDNLKEQRHGSTYLHTNISMVLYGMDRAVSHEVVRHAIGNGFSQVSQRYVDGKVLRFVMPFEIQGDAEMEAMFFEDVERAVNRYEMWGQKLLSRQVAGFAALAADKKRDARKKVNQCARRVLINATEAPIFLTGNMRAWRHGVEQRANRHADVAIRAVYLQAFQCLKIVVPNLLSDYRSEELSDGTQELTTPFTKI